MTLGRASHLHLRGPGRPFALLDLNNGNRPEFYTTAILQTECYMNSCLKHVVSALALLSALVLAAAPALAHRVNVFAVLENGVVNGEGYFGGGSKALDSQVEITDASGALLASGRTGEDGGFRIALPAGAAPPLTVVLKAGEGHRGEYTLTGQESTAGTEPEASAPVPGAGAATAVPGASTMPVQAGSGLAMAQDPADARLSALVQAAAARAVEEKLTPLRLELAKIAEAEQATRLRDIVGGLGWIIGLIGLAAWFKRPGR